MTTDKNLLLLGSVFPSDIENELIEVAATLGMKIVPADIGNFKSKERYCELYPKQSHLFVENKEEISGARVHIVMNMDTDPNTFFVDAINIPETVKEYGAKYIHAILCPPFTRQDRAFDNRLVSIMGKTFPKHLKCAGVDEISTFDMHSKASEKFFTDFFGGTNVHFLSAVDAIYDSVKKMVPSNETIKFGAPDGADKPLDVAQRKARAITRLCYGDKNDMAQHMFGIVKSHIGVNKTEVHEFIGNVQDCTAVMIDDMTDTGGTLVNGAFALKQNGAKRVIAAVTHGFFSDNSLDILTADTIGDKPNPIDILMVTDSILGIYDKVAALPQAQQDRIKIVRMAPLIKHALKLAA